MRGTRLACELMTSQCSEVLASKEFLKLKSTVLQDPNYIYRVDMAESFGEMSLKFPEYFYPKLRDDLKSDIEYVKSLHPVPVR